MTALNEMLLLTMFLICCSFANVKSATLRNNNGHLALYPRVGKRYSVPRRDFLSSLANKWQRTGSLRGAIHEIQDMTEKRSLDGITGHQGIDDETDDVRQVPPRYLLLIRRDLDYDMIRQPEDLYDDFVFKVKPGRRNFY